MAINFQWNASEYEERSFQLIPEGDHRVRINEVTEQTFKSGKQGLKIVLDVSGYSSKLFYYLVFDPQNTKMTNQKIGEIFSSFEITNPNLNMYPGWVGKIGACRVKHELYNGEKSAKVWYFTSKKSQASLPAWKEPAGTVSNTAPAPASAPFPGPTDFLDTYENAPF